MPRTIEKTVTLFTFDELEGRAKERARETLQRLATSDGFWHEGITKVDAIECAKLAGFEIEQVMFTGFWSQGDGACFEGAWNADNVNMDIPADALPEPYRAAILEARQLAGRIAEGWRVRARAKHRGRYYHQRSMDVRADCEWTGPEECEPREFPFNIDDECDALCTSFASAIYGELEKEYLYCMADEQLSDNADANGCEFTEDGELD
jgi:hypothetical protein